MVVIMIVKRIVPGYNVRKKKSCLLRRDCHCLVSTQILDTRFLNSKSSPTGVNFFCKKKHWLNKPRNLRERIRAECADCWVGRVIQVPAPRFKMRKAHAEPSKIASGVESRKTTSTPFAILNSVQRIRCRCHGAHALPDRNTCRIRHRQHIPPGDERERQRKAHGNPGVCDGHRACELHRVHFGRRNDKIRGARPLIDGEKLPRCRVGNLAIVGEFGAGSSGCKRIKRRERFLSPRQREKLVDFHSGTIGLKREGNPRQTCGELLGKHLLRSSLVVKIAVIPRCRRRGGRTKDGHARDGRPFVWRQMCNGREPGRHRRGLDEIASGISGVAQGAYRKRRWACAVVVVIVTRNHRCAVAQRSNVA